MVAQDNAHRVPASLLVMLNNSWRGMKPKLGGFLCLSVPFELENPLCWFSSGLSGGGVRCLSVRTQPEPLSLCRRRWGAFRSLCCRKSDAAEVKQSCSAAADCVQTDFVHFVRSVKLDFSFWSFDAQFLADRTVVVVTWESFISGVLPPAIQQKDKTTFLWEKHQDTEIIWRWEELLSILATVCNKTLSKMFWAVSRGGD